MKRKDLHEYVRQVIINELSEAGTYAGNKAVDDMKKDPDYNTLNSMAKADSEKKLKAGGSVTIGEMDIDEMARKAGAFGKGSKFDDAKSIYEKGLISYILKAIEELGENATPSNIETKIKEDNPGISTGDVGNILRNFKAVDILSGGPLAAAPKPEKGAKEEEPEDEEPMDMEEPETEEEPEEEEAPEEEPTVVSKAASGLGADIEKLAQLNKQKDELVKKLKAKEITMDQYKEKIGDIPNQIKALQAKIDRYSE